MGTIMFVGDIVLRIFCTTIIACSISAVLVAVSEIITELISSRELFKNSADNVEDISFSTYRKPVEKG